METVTDFILLSSKITMDGECSHEIKRCLLLERIVMTNLDSILKSRDISLPTKVQLVKQSYGFSSSHVWMWELDYKESWVLGAIMGDPTHDEVIKKIRDRQGRPGPHPWQGHKEKTWQARPSRIRDPPGWPRPLPHPVSSPLFCCCSCFPCCGFLCCLLRALLLLFHWIKTNLKP